MMLISLRPWFGLCRFEVLEVWSEALFSTVRSSKCPVVLIEFWPSATANGTE
jgi:hypothetical protein